MNRTAVAQPVDVRLMNATASAVFMAAFALVLTAAVLWALRNPAFAIGNIVVGGSPQHSSALALQSNVVPKLNGNLFTLDLDEARKAFEQMPWVRNAALSRVFPNTLQVQIEEHVPVALWDDDSANTSMVNSFGEVFEANRGEVEHQNLPRLSGPREQSGQVLAMHRQLEPLFAQHQIGLQALYLNVRGNWQAVLGNNGLIELGSGNPQEVAARLQRFLLSLPAILRPLQKSAASLEYADLRYGNGYAIRMKGVITGERAEKAEKKTTPAVAQSATQAAGRSASRQR